MPIRTFFVGLTPASDMEAVLDNALLFAEKMEGHLEVAYLQPDFVDLSGDAALAAAATSYPVRPYEELLAQHEKAEGEARQRFDAWRAKRNLPSDILHKMLRSLYARWIQSDAPPDVTLVHRARLSDVTVLPLRHKRLGTEAALLDAALFESGRPVLLLPPKIQAAPFVRMALAWNGSLQSARSLSHAIPFLHEAADVHILFVARKKESAYGRVGIPPSEVCEALSWQGIRARVVTIVPEEDEEVGAALLRVAKEQDVGMLALGAFTHSRLREAMLGGVTKHVLDHADLPLLMSH